MKRKPGDSTFEALWNQGMTVTPGSRLGARWLGYPGDPLRFHACCAVVDESVMCGNRPMRAMDLVRFARVCHTAAKASVLSFEDDSAPPSFVTLEWRP